jgi:FixJ family two-component response regulator
MIAGDPTALLTSWRGAASGHALRPGSDARPGVTAARDSWVAIIEDHQSMRASLARVMRMEGIRAGVFTSAEEFLDHAAPTAPCCLVLDMQLPGMSGLALAQLLERERPPLPPTIFISAHDDLLTSLDGGHLAYGRLRKPFQVDALLALVKPLL